MGRENVRTGERRGRKDQGLLIKENYRLRENKNEELKSERTKGQKDDRTKGSKD